MAEARGSVSGPNDKHQVMFYGLSTCIWCKRTRQFLEGSGVRFDYVYVDLLHGKEREAVVKEVRRWNPRTNFPTVVVDASKVVIGYRPDDLREVLEL